MFQFQIESAKSDTSLCSDSNNDSSSVDIVNCQYSIGNRVQCDSYLGTVRYIGLVNPHPGLWLGVEWDDPCRGKHDGIVDGVEYFKVGQPRAASFVRPSKVKKLRQIFEAINERYGYDVNVINSLQDIAGGLERRKVDYSALKVVDVSSRQVSDLGRRGELADLTPNVEFLYIADNLITDWEAIGDLCVGLNRMKGLDVSENVLQPVPEKLSETLETVFQNLEHIIMGKLKYDWNEIMKASFMWKKLKNLQVQYNKIDHLSPPQATLLNLTSLDLGGNQISEWNEIIKLNVLTMLEYLNLSGNRIGSLRFPLEIRNEANSSCTSIFPNLARLNISENSIPDWISVNELNKLSELKELRIDTNPFLDSDTRPNNRQMIIARIGRLQKLDGVEITKQERRDAELDYIKKFASKWNSEGGILRPFMDHPRYADLTKIYGCSEDGESGDGAPKTMKSTLINLQLIPEDSSQNPQTKKLLQTMTVQKVKMLLQRLFKLSGIPIEIKVVSGRNDRISFPLDNDFYDLSQYSLEDGDKLYLKW